MTSRKHADYIYRNKHDSLRVRVHRRENGRWDYDVFYPTGQIATYSDGAGDDFATKRSALAEANNQHGSLHAIVVDGNVVDAAWYRRETSKPSRAHSPMRKKPSQLDSEIAEAMKVGRAEVDDEGVFYLADKQSRDLGSDFRSRHAAKRAAMKLVRGGAHRMVEVWHRWRGGRYMQGLANEDGWSDV